MSTLEARKKPTVELAINPMPGLPGLEWQKHIPVSDRDGFYLVYNPDTFETKLMHLVRPAEAQDAAEVDNGYRYLGPLPRPPVYWAYATTDGFTRDPAVTSW